MPILALALLVPSLGAGEYYAPFGPPETALIEVPFNNANLYPYGGWTLYPGEAGSGVPTMSNYSHVNGLVPPAVSARSVLARLQQLGIPIIAPEPEFLNKNPAITEGLILPVPKSWRKPREEPKVEPQVEPKKEIKPKEDKKDEKKKDDDD
jgi:hypothetical protein